MDTINAYDSSKVYLWTGDSYESKDKEVQMNLYGPSSLHVSTYQSEIQGYIKRQGRLVNTLHTGLVRQEDNSFLNILYSFFSLSRKNGAGIKGAERSIHGQLILPPAEDLSPMIALNGAKCSDIPLSLVGSVAPELANVKAKIKDSKLAYFVKKSVDKQIEIAQKQAALKKIETVQNTHELYSAISEYKNLDPNNPDSTKTHMIC
ncbi:MAG: hypothetical protein MK033_02260 [Candidatus Caenarcaniphilales bacterium]|nr:hypothetical protein [Candidatus Caenarcaniphilales bacterium]